MNFEEGQGSFDSARASLCEAFASLRKTSGVLAVRRSVSAQEDVGWL